MKKILISLAMIAAVGAIAIGATTAFFSDTETSTGNTFTAGSLDLIVDIDGVDENPLLDGPIFNLPDMKPGDTGEKTISLKVNNNPACGKVDINLASDLDNSCTEPEIGDEASCVSDVDGELNDQTQFIIFSDPDCDNLYEEANGSELLTQGTLTGNASYYIGELPIAPAKTCYGIAYCFGSPIVTPSGITCNGASINNLAQTDSFSANMVITAEQKRSQYPNGCPVGGSQTPVQMAYVSLENKDTNWAVISNDNIQGTMQYSTNDTTFHGVVNATGLAAGGIYQISLNGSGQCSVTDGLLASATGDLFKSGYWNAGPNLDSNCVNASNQGQGVYNMNLVSDTYTAIADSSGNLNYSFNLNLPNGTYSNVKVLVKKTLSPFVSPWTDSSTVHTTNLYEVSNINFTVN